MSQRDVILSMVEAASCTLDIANNSENEISQPEQFDIILRVIPFFNEILSMVNSATAHQLPELKNVINSFLKGCNRCMIFISKEAPIENLNIFINFLDNLISSCLVAECIDSVSHLLVGILNTREIPKERVTLFSKIFKTFFMASDLRSEFIKGDGILTAWFTYVVEPENPLILDVFILFETYIEFFSLPDFFSHISDLIAAISASFTTLSLKSAKFIFSIIQKIVALNPKLYIQKLNESLFFQSIYLFIIQHQDEDPNLISYLEFFTTLVPFSAVCQPQITDDGKKIYAKIPSLDMTINVISSMECKVPLRHRALKGIEGILPYVTEENFPFTTDQISLIANAIPINDPQSVYIFSTICLDLNIQANFDISPLIPFLTRFITIDLLLSIDMTKYISLFLEYQTEVSPFMPALYISVFKKLTPELFSELVNRYGHLFAFFSQHFEEPLSNEQLEHFLELFILSFPFYRDFGGAVSCLINIISFKKGYIFTKTIFETLEKIASTTYDLKSDAESDENKKNVPISSSISSSNFVAHDSKKIMENGRYDLTDLLTSLTKTVNESFQFRSECIIQKVFIQLLDFHDKYQISGKTILDFISALANHIYIPSLDAAVYLKLKEVKFMGMNKQQLLRFALGLRQIEKIAKSEKPSDLSKQTKSMNDIDTNQENQSLSQSAPPLKDVRINNEVEENHESKPISSHAKVTICELNQGFSEMNNDIDIISKSYSSSFTQENPFLNNSQENFYQAINSCSLEDEPQFMKTSVDSFSTSHGKVQISEVPSRRSSLTNLSNQKGSLCFPSILGHCDDYIFTSRYDIFICGRVGLSAWLRDTGRPISEFPSIVNVAKQYARLEHLEMLIDHPKIFYNTCSKLIQIPPLFEFKKGFDCSFSISSSSSLSCLPTPGFSSQIIKSFCFWFQTTEFSQKETNFCSINQCILLFLVNNEIKFDKSSSGKFEIGKWTFFAASSDSQNPSIVNIYIDTKLAFKVHSKNGFAPSGNNKSLVTFGGRNTDITWFIGGTIRIFSEPISTEILNKIYSYGISSSLSSDQLNINSNTKNLPFEMISKSPLMSAPLFNEEDIEMHLHESKESDTNNYIKSAIHYANIVNGSVLDRKERAIPIYSLLNYIHNIKNKSVFIIKRALQFIEENDYVNANYLLKSICILKKNGIIKQTNENFALSISVLFHTAPDILTDDTIDLIMECFEKNNKVAKDTKVRALNNDKNVVFDWNSFFIFAFDYSLLYSKHAVIFISKFFELNARYPITDEMSRYSFTLYLFSLLMIPEFDKQLSESILDFILKLNPDSSLLLFLLASYPNMAVGVNDLSQPYSFDDDDNTIALILNLISNLRMKQFNYYFLLSVLPSAMASKLIGTLTDQHLQSLKGTSKSIQNQSSSQYTQPPSYSTFSPPVKNYSLESIDLTEIFDDLFHTVFMPDSWFAAISIVTGTLEIDDLQNLQFNNFDLNFFEPFFKMFALLACACFKISADSFWTRFAAHLSEQMILIIPTLPEKIITKSLKFWVIQLMTFGQSFDKMSSFPPYPLAFTSQDILEYIEVREQKYPTTYGKPFTFQPVLFPFSSTPNKLYNEMFDQVSKYVDFISPKEFCINGICKYNVNHKKNHKVFNEIFDSNITYVAKDWVEYINGIIENFGLDAEEIPVKEHPLTDILIRLLSTFVVHCPSLFHTIFDTMSIFPNDLMMIHVQKITICSLNLCEHQKIFHQQLIDLACKRAMEGWYTSQYVNVLTHIFKIVNHCFYNDTSLQPNSNYQLPISFYNSIIFGFDVIPGGDVPKLMNLISENKHIFISQTFVMNFDLCLTFISKMFANLNIFPNSFYQLWSYFISTIKSIDQFQIQWNKTFAQQQSKLIGLQQNTQQGEFIDFTTLILILTVLEKEGAEGFICWKKDNAKTFIPFENLYLNAMTKYHQQVLKEISTEIDSLMKSRNDNSVEFIQRSNNIIIERSKKVTCNKAKAGCLRQIYREYFIFMNLFFIRRRERFISNYFPITFNKNPSESKRKAITILTDPIFPTRRLEGSPLGYTIPSFPDGTYKEIFPEKPSTLPFFDDISYSSSIRELFSYNLVRVPLLLRYSDHQLHAKFTQFLPVKPYQNLTILSLLYNKGNSFQYICNCSLLYGIETLNGCLFVSDNVMYFGEGFQINEDDKNDGFVFVDPNQSLSYHFYFQSMLTNHFGQFYLYQGHPILEWPFEDIIAAYPHIWIHKPYSITLNFLRGFNFVLNFKKPDFDYIFPLLKRHSTSFFDSAPPSSPIHTIISNVNSARYLQLNGKEIVNRWQNGEIDTFTYLCILNRFGKRPTCDMTQYPVFPWIITDYNSPVLNLYPSTNEGEENSSNKNPSQIANSSNFRDLSLPMGQIGKKRSERFNEFYKDTNNQYYYGTHYMHYGVVLYFMFRVDPFTFFSIELNKGWDHPNRLFFNLGDSWLSAAYDSPTDLKEVIPQFFLVPEIFENTSHLPLTTNDDGVSISSVKLPNWAKNARAMSDIFLKLIECDYVQKNINYWIDMIFGDKSRGQNAREIKNLFHPLCYAPVKKHRDGSGEDTDPDSLEDDVSREASIVSIINFGQCPQQVIYKPHPQIKYSKYWRILSSPIISSQVLSSLESLSPSQNYQMPKSDSQSSNEDNQSPNESKQSAQTSSDMSASELPSNISSLMMYGEIISRSQMSLTSNWQRLRTDSFFMPPYASYCDNTNIVLSCNHKISAFVPPTGQFLYIEEGIILLTNKNQNEVFKLHQSQMFLTASSAAFSADGLYLIISLRDGAVFLYKMSYVKGEARSAKLMHIFSAYASEYEFYEDENANQENNKLTPSNSIDGQISSSSEIVVDQSERYMNRVHDLESICISSEHFIAFAASRNRIVQFDIGLHSNMPYIQLDFAVKKVEVDDPAALLFAVGNFDIAVISISGEVLMRKKTTSQITCIVASKLPQYFVGRFFSTGHYDGKVCFWNISYQENELNEIGWCKLSDEPIVSLALSSNSQRMIAGTKSEMFSCECQNNGGGVTLNLIKAIRIASQIAKKNQNLQSKNKENNDEKSLSLRDSEDGFTVVDINNVKDDEQHSITPPSLGFKTETYSVPFISAAMGSTGGCLTGIINNIGSGSGAGGNVSCTPLRKENFAMECAACHSDIKRNAIVCTRCQRFFCQKCITKEMNALKSTATCILCMPSQFNSETNAQANSKISNE